MFFSVSQLFYAVQSNMLQPAQQKVLSQLRIPITAFLAKVIMGHGYTGLQWMMIVSITIAVFEFSLLTKPNDGREYLPVCFDENTITKYIECNVEDLS